MINGYAVIQQSDNTYSLPSYTGTVQWNGTMKKFQVSNGVGWTDIDNYVTYNVDSKLQDVVQWAWTKMQEEKEMQAMLDKHPALRDAKDKYDIVYALIKDQSA